MKFKYKCKICHKEYKYKFNLIEGIIFYIPFLTIKNDITCGDCIK